MFVAAWYLMTHKEEGLYTLCLNRVLLRLRLKFDQVPNPLRFVGDFEWAILQSLKNVLG